MDLKYLLLMIALVEINHTESRHSDKRRWKNEKSIYSNYVNVCDIQDRVSKVHCYCDSLKIKSAKKADCWVFNGGIAEDDPFWPNFFSQPIIEKLSFNVRADGGLTYIPAKVIVRLDRLKHLNIQYANIFSIPSFALANSSTLEEISLLKNKITKLEKMAFAHLILLTNVSLVENQISELKRDVFYVLPNLKKLLLSKNTISVLHDGCFQHLNNLKKLNLDSNLLTVLIRENFQGLSNLITLDMRNNKLRMIGDLAFAELWSLEELYLDRNEIEFISERGLGGLTQLKKLSLADNKLSTLDDGVLADIQKLNLLDLRNNNLETLKQVTVEAALDNMKLNYAIISLDGNRLTCDCRLSWLHKLRNETTSKRLKASLDRLNCVMEKTPKSHHPSLVQIETIPKLSNNIPFRKDEKAYDDFENEFDDAKDYENTLQDQDDHNIEIEYRKKFLEIPLEQLPCPKKLSFEDDYSSPTKDEVRFYKGSSDEVRLSISLLISMFVVNVQL